MMRKKLISAFMTMALFLSLPVYSIAQSANSLDYLLKAYPKLTNLYLDELKKYHAHYIFAIDVSGTMNQYQGDVSRALVPFFQALPDNDMVDVIPFGTDAMGGMANYSGIINSSSRSALCQNISKLYNDPSYPDGFRGYTNIPKVIQAITKVISTNRNYQINVIVIITDFKNDEKGDSPSEHKIKDNVLDDIASAMRGATNNSYNRFVALELPVNRAASGYCLDQLRKVVFEDNMEVVSMANSTSMISNWFDGLKREIMVDKLRAVIENANKVNSARLEIETTIDGKVFAEIHWTPSKLYPSIKIDSTYVKQKGFVFINKKENFKNTRDSVIGVDPELLLGKIVCDSWGFHHFNDSIYLGLTLPTEYDNELEALNVRKPIPATTRAEDRWIFTFFIPFWLTVTLIVLFVLYVIGIFRAIGRNSAYKLSGKVTVSENGQPLNGFPARINPCDSINVGSNGHGRFKVNGANWNLEVRKVNGNVLLSFFSTPHFVWRASKGCVIAGDKSISGKLVKGSTLAVRCGQNRSSLVNSVRMQII